MSSGTPPPSPSGPPPPPAPQPQARARLNATTSLEQDKIEPPRAPRPQPDSSAGRSAGEATTPEPRAPHASSREGTDKAGKETASSSVLSPQQGEQGEHTGQAPTEAQSGHSAVLRLQHPERVAVNCMAIPAVSISLLPPVQQLQADHMAHSQACLLCGPPWIPQPSEWLGSLLPVLCLTSGLSLVILHPSE